MDEVYFLKNSSKLSLATEKILKNFYQKGNPIVAKIHFGEPGNKTALTPKEVQPIMNVLNNFGFQIILTDTPVAYTSARSTVAGYQKVAKQKGFDKLGKLLISNEGVKVKTKDFVAKIAKPLAKAKNVLVISHVKGHSCSGFGGAIKNLGMGGVTKETKQLEHDLCKPVFVKECQGCQTCAKLCPAKAIKMDKGKAVFDLGECWGCSICILECPFKCLAPKKAIFDDLLAQAAAAVINHLPVKTYYINILKNISQFCDCSSSSGQILSKDIGILFSKNPVAIDKASVDLINKNNGKNLFYENHHKDPYLQIQFAQKYTKFSEGYKLIEF